MPRGPESGVVVTARPATCRGKEAIHMVPLLLWILGVPGLIIILLLLIGVIKI